MWRLYLLFLGLLLAILNNVTPAVTCTEGYAVSLEDTCIDEDECDEDLPRCGNNTVCYNTNGSYYCNCVTGYQSTSRAVNFTAVEGVECEDINECVENKTICGPNAKCTNTPASFYCTCRSGFVSNTEQERFNASQSNTCEDINECLKISAICGPNASCTNTDGSYFCTCDPGFVPTHFQFNATQNVTCHVLEFKRPGNRSLPGQIPDELEQIWEELYDMSMQKGATGEELLQILHEALEDFLSKKPLTNTSMISALFELVENALQLIGYLLVNSSVSRSSPHIRIEMLIQRGLTAPRGKLSLSTNETQFNSHWESAVGNLYKGSASASLFEYQSLKSPINSPINSYFSGTHISSNQFQLNSKVVTIAVTNPNTAHLEKPIRLSFTHMQETKRNITCVFWDATLEGGAWSTEGCNVVEYSANHTVCSCSHLSSFAVLMALYEMDNVFELQLITWIGLSLSLICLLICILTFWLIRSIQSTRTTIHLHLCISLFIADFIFLVGISQTGDKVGCAVVAGLLHFFFLAVFCWMCLEGVQLFRMVVLVFNTTLSRAYMMAAGYGVPALIVIISASVNYGGYGTSRYCWLNLENGFIWSFFGPVCVIIVVNAIFFLITVSKLAEKFNSLNPDLSNLRKIKAFTITAIAQLCVLGTMWIFGCFQFDEEMVVMSYIFTILNSLQGVLVFIMHCLLSKQVREEYVRFLTCLTTPQKRSYSEFSTNQSSKSQTSKSTHTTGESRI